MKIKSFLKNEYAMGVVVNVLSLLVGIVYSSMLARYLGAEIKGETAYISSVVGIVNIILSFGLHQVYAYYRKTDGDVKNRYMNNIYAIFAVYALIATVLCVLYRGNLTLAAIIILSVIAAYMRVSGYVYLVENSVKRNILMLFVHILQLGFVGILMLVTKASLFWGVVNLIFLDLVLSVIYTAKLGVRINFKEVDIRFIGRIFGMGFVPMITILSSSLNYRVDILMMRAFPNVTLAQIGVYSIGVMLAEKVLLIPDALKSILLSKLAKGKTAEEVARVMRMCFPTCFIMFAGIAILGQPFIDFIYGAQYADAYMVTVIIMFGICAMMFHKMVEIYNIVNHRQSFTLMVLITSTILNVALNLYLIPRYAIIGAAVATVASDVYCAVVCLTDFSKRTKIKIRDMIFIKREDIKAMKTLFGKKSRL